MSVYKQTVQKNFFRKQTDSKSGRVKDLVNYNIALSMVYISMGRVR